MRLYPGLSGGPTIYGILHAAQVFSLSCVLLLPIACRTGDKSSRPTIEFTKIPPAAKGGRERVDSISGKVAGAQSGDSVVIYAHSGPWWIQPWPDHSLLPIQKDLSWKTETHLGYQYAALLVKPNYKPAATLDAAPEIGGGVLALKIVDGVGSLPPPPTVPIRFSGYNWDIDTTSGVRGGFNHLFSPDNVWVDEKGALHLRIQKTAKGWICAHLVLAESLGYGTYTFRVRDATHLDPANILSFDTFDEHAPDQHYRELDIELGRWGNPAIKVNSQVGIQPFYVPGNIVQLQDPPGRLTHVLHWRPGVATFETYRDSFDGSPRSLVYKHVIESGVPSSGQELPEFMFYRVNSDSEVVKQNSEIVIEQFSFAP
jgi:hypothetical protein